jgi:hypothetical protein
MLVCRRMGWVEGRREVWGDDNTGAALKPIRRQRAEGEDARPNEELEMASDPGTTIITDALPLIGVLIGTAATISVQRSSARLSQLRLSADSRQAQRAEIKTGIVAYLEIVQHLRTQVDSREKGERSRSSKHGRTSVACTKASRHYLLRATARTAGTARYGITQGDAP